MLMITLFGLTYEISDILIYFFIYSFLGWAMESTINSIRNKRFINRGFLNGPICPIYGFGMVGIYLFCSPFANNWILLFFAGMVFATLVELLTGWLLEVLFKSRWWDYSHKKFNIKGYICLEISICWGFLSFGFIEFIQPLFVSLVSLIPSQIEAIMIYVILSIFTIDLIFSIRSALKISTILTKVVALKEELLNYADKMKDKANEYKRMLEETKPVVMLINTLSEIKEKFGQFFSNKNLFNEVQDEYKKISTHHLFGLFGRARILNAFPKIKAIIKKGKDDHNATK